MPSILDDYSISSKLWQYNIISEEKRHPVDASGAWLKLSGGIIQLSGEVLQF
jgi:hypothetical protein